MKLNMDAKGKGMPDVKAQRSLRRIGHIHILLVLKKKGGTNFLGSSCQPCQTAFQRGRHKAVRAGCVHMTGPISFVSLGLALAWGHSTFDVP